MVGGIVFGVIAIVCLFIVFMTFTSSKTDYSTLWVSNIIACTAIFCSIFWVCLFLSLYNLDVILLSQ